GTLVDYHSNPPAVASVDPRNFIRTAAAGVATITASVKYQGARKSTQFTICVLPELDSLTVAGQRVPGFEPDKYSYDVIVPDDVTSAPHVDAGTPDGTATVEVTQANGVPGSATITVTSADGIPITYTIYFAHPA